MTLVYRPGERALRTVPGDLVLLHRHTLASHLIGIGQRLRFRKADRPFAHWTHVACIVGYKGELVEALGHGVELTDVSRYDALDYRIVDTKASKDDREQMVRFALDCVGRPYGWAEIASLGLTLLTGGKLGFGNAGTLICSTLAAQMLCRGDYVFSFDPNRAMPADIAKAVGVRT